jgi:hypothetical protein
MYIFISMDIRMTINTDQIVSIDVNVCDGDVHANIMHTYYNSQ